MFNEKEGSFDVPFYSPNFLDKSLESREKRKRQENKFYKRLKAQGYRFSFYDDHYIAVLDPRRVNFQ